MSQPVQPVNVEPLAVAALSVTGMPASNSAEQLAPHSIPAGALVTVPVPEPLVVTVNVSCAAAAA